MSEEAPKFKVVFVGDSTVGKTSLIHNFLHLDPTTTSTLGATSSKIESVVENQKLMITIWDTAGQDTFRNLVPVYAKGSSAAVIVFDQTNQETWDHVTDWLSYLEEHVGKLSVILAANKSDLESAVDFNQVYAWASDHNLQVIRTSAKDGTNVETLFDQVSQELYKQYKESTATTEKQEVSEPKVETIPNEPKEKAPEAKKSGCCN